MLGQREKSREEERVEIVEGEKLYYLLWEDTQS